MNRKLADLLYAPFGLVTGASKVIPELAEQGRVQVANAKLIGQMATRMGTAKITEQVDGITAQARGVLEHLGLVAPESAEPNEANPVHRAHREPSTAPSADTPVASSPAHQKAATPADEMVAPTSDALAIVDYDSLAASQVVPRLAALKADQLENVRQYELAHRGRKTILGRIAQLQR